MAFGRSCSFGSVRVPLRRVSGARLAICIAFCARLGEKLSDELNQRGDIVRLLFAMIAVSAFTWTVSAHGQAQVIKVTPGQAQCLAENIGTYESYETDPVIIVLETCPRPPSNDQLTTSLVQKRSGPGLPLPKVGKGDNILILLRSQLACVKEIVTDGDLSADETGLIEISLENCSE